MNLILELYKNDCIKVGSFTLKNGDRSNIYIDLKNIISYPTIVNYIESEIFKKIKNIKFDRIIGIPYGGIPIASMVSFYHNIPMILIRKEPKYGLKKQIEGYYNIHDEVILIEDTITTGSSLLKFANILESYNLVVKYIIVICDQRETPSDKLDKYPIISIITLNDIMSFLSRYKIIEKVNTINSNNKITNTLISIIKQKNINLALHIKNTLVNIENHTFINNICILKINSFKLHINDVNKIIELSKQNNFLILEETIFNHNQKTFFNLFTKNNELYKWINIITLVDTSLHHIIPIIKLLNINIGIIVKYTSIDITIFKCIIQQYKPYILGFIDFNFKNTSFLNINNDIIFID